MINYAIYLVFLFFRFIITTLSWQSNIKIFKTIGSFLYFLNLKHRKIIIKNLDLCFGDKLSFDEKNKIAKKVYQNFLIYIAKFIEISNKDLNYLNSIINYKNLEFLTNLIKKNEKIILISAHYGAWEMILQAIGGNFRAITTIREDIMNSPLLNQTMIKYRSKNNIEMFYKKGALLGIAKALKKGKIVAYLVDQNYKHGTDALFFGKKVKHIDSASALSKKFDAYILPVFCYSNDHIHYTIEFLEPFKCNDIAKCTQKQSDIIEMMVKKRIDNYFWFHKKFKATYKDMYKNF